MPGPYTAFTFGTPAVQPAILTRVAIRLQGPNFGSAGDNPVPVAQVLQGGVVGTAYSETITAQRGTSPYSFAVVSGALPAGLSMPSSGVISGTPTTAATYNFTVQVTDANGSTGSQAFRIVVTTASSGQVAYAFVG